MRPFQLLAGGVRPDGGTLDDLLRVDAEDAAVDLDAEPVEAARRGAALLLSHPVVLRSMARTLEPLRAWAPGHAAPQVHALLVQRHDAVLHAGEHCARIR